MPGAAATAIFVMLCATCTMAQSLPQSLPYANPCTVNFTGGPRLPFPMCNTTLDLASRVADLVSRLTAEEKCAALDTSNPAIPRLGIPHLPVGEGLHGVVTGCLPPNPVTGGSGCPTSFPNPTALGASFGEPCSAHARCPSGSCCW